MLAILATAGTHNCFHLLWQYIDQGLEIQPKRSVSLPDSGDSISVVPLSEFPRYQSPSVVRADDVRRGGDWVGINVQEKAHEYE
jgi:hypothetical protein